jgi:hypothetical protein
MEMTLHPHTYNLTPWGETWRAALALLLMVCVAIAWVPLMLVEAVTVAVCWCLRKGAYGS